MVVMDTTAQACNQEPHPLRLGAQLRPRVPLFAMKSVRREGGREGGMGAV